MSDEKKKHHPSQRTPDGEPAPPAGDRDRVRKPSSNPREELVRRGPEIRAPGDDGMRIS